MQNTVYMHKLTPHYRVVADYRPFAGLNDLWTNSVIAESDTRAGAIENMREFLATKRVVRAAIVPIFVP